jgi:FkbM family methyltransferase
MLTKVKFNRFSVLTNALLCKMQQHEWPGKYRFYKWFSKKFGDHIIQHQLGKLAFVVPVDEWCFWSEFGPQNYYLNEFVPFFDIINAYEQEFIFIDMGADIGTVSALASVYCPKLLNIIAFEPNPQSYNLLHANLSNINKPSLAINAAVSDFVGKASFNHSTTSTIDHEGHIDLTKEGNTDVTSLDAWFAQNESRLPLLVVLKIDVEGQEDAVLRGAQHLLKQCQNCVLLLEIHPDVLSASNMQAEHLFEQAEAIRPLTWMVPLLGNQIVNRDLPLFDQVPRGQYDIIGVSSIN